MALTILGIVSPQRATLSAARRRQGCILFEKTTVPLATQSNKKFRLFHYFSILYQTFPDSKIGTLSNSVERSRG